MGLLDHAFPYITSSRLHQVLHRPIHTSVSFLLNVSFIMPYNPRSEVQCIAPPPPGRGSKTLLLLKQGGPEAALAVVRRTCFRTKTRQLCWPITQSAVSNISRLCHSIISDICHSSQGFSGRLCEPWPSSEKSIMKGGATSAIPRRE